MPSVRAKQIGCVSVVLLTVTFRVCWSRVICAAHAPPQGARWNDWLRVPPVRPGGGANGDAAEQYQDAAGRCGRLPVQRLSSVRLDPCRHQSRVHEHRYSPGLLEPRGEGESTTRTY